jgi:hypothetical protein
VLGQTAQIQTIQLATTSGADDAKLATDVSTANPLPVLPSGELIEHLSALRMAIQALTRSVGLITVDPTTGRLRAEVIQATAASLQTTATIASGTVTTVTTCSTLTNQSQIGGIASQRPDPRADDDCAPTYLCSATSR